MKRKLILALFASASILPFAASAAEHDHGSHHGAEAAAPAAKGQLMEATVKKLNKDNGRVTLSHGAMNGMPPMTMVFTVKDKAMLKGVKEGGKVQFRAENVNGAMELVELKPLAK